MTSKLLFKHNSKKIKSAKVNGGNAKKDFFNKLSGAFMLPISVMAIAGLFLGIGATIVSRANDNDQTTFTAWETIGAFVQAIGDPIFTAMPVLFAIAIVIAFSDEAGVGVFAVVVGMLTFSSIQSAFIHPVYAPGAAIDGYSKDIIGYNILFTQGGRDPIDLFQLVGKTMGITSLNSSIFGGIIIGTITSYLYNRYHTIKLPLVISFFGGKKFVAIITIIATIPLALLFLIFWPWIGIGLNKFGTALSDVPYGFDSFVFGFIEKSLIPFGLHHIFYAPLWWTSAGGNAEIAFNNWIAQGNILDGSLLAEFRAAFSATGAKWEGDSFIWISANSLPFNTVAWHDANGIAHSMPVFDFFSKELHIKLGRFLDGQYPSMMFGLPAAAAAMVMAAPKENRKMALGTILPAGLTSFLTGVTEPIEFTFLFLAPLLFWGFHATMCAISFILMNLLGTHIGMTFSGGMFDIIIYGILPIAKGTHFWWAFIVGAAYAPIYYLVFYFWIKKGNLDTPGRGGNTKLFTKAIYKASKKANKNNMTQQSKNIVIAFGGWDNITSYNNCATRLRYEVKDITKVNEEQMKGAGAYGVIKAGAKMFHVIMGPSAGQINVNITGHKNEALTNVENVATSSKKTMPVK